MRHVCIRGLLALVWFAAAVFSGVTGNLEWAGLYVLMGAAFGYSAWAAPGTARGRTCSRTSPSSCGPMRWWGSSA